MTHRFATRAVRAGLNADPGHNAVVAPISVSACYRRQDPGQPGAFDYARTQQPSRALLESALAELEGAAGATVTASGMAAIDLILNDLPPHAHVVCAHDCYGGTRRLFDARAAQQRIALTYADTTDPDTLQAALRKGADLLFVETPSNPRLRLTDIEQTARLGHDAGAIVAVDNTVLTPALQRPLSLGADISVSSVTKMLNGHSDMVGGVVACSDADRHTRLAWWANAAGLGASAFDSFLATRGLRTLPLRARAQCETALELASRLAAHPAIVRVDYPFLKGHPGRGIAAAQQSGGGPLLSLEVSGGTAQAIELVKSLQLFTLAQSLGGVESLVCIPATMTHAAMSAEARAEAGIADGLVRLSVGIEDVEDLWEDLQAGLEIR